MTIFNKKPTIFKNKNISFRFSINNSKYVHFWTIALETILILLKFPLQQYKSCRHLNVDATYENGRHDGFPSYWKSGILGLQDRFVVCTKFFLEVTGWYRNLKQEFSLDSKIFTGLYYRTWIICFKTAKLVLEDNRYSKSILSESKTKAVKCMSVTYLARLFFISAILTAQLGPSN